VGEAGFEHIPLHSLARTYGSSSAAVKGSRPWGAKAGIVDWGGFIWSSQ